MSLTHFLTLCGTCVCQVVTSNPISISNPINIKNPNINGIKNTALGAGDPFQKSDSLISGLTNLVGGLLRGPLG